MTTSQEPQDPLIPVGKETKHGVIIVDACDADLLRLCRATATRVGYVYVTASHYKKNKRSSVYLHRLVMERVAGRELNQSEHIDHINKNTLDCRRSNLRIATHSQNHANRKIPSTNTSGYKGVMWIKRLKKWGAEITKDRVAHRLGYFADPAAAHEAYMVAARELFGEFASDGIESGKTDVVYRLAPPMQQPEVKEYDAATVHIALVTTNINAALRRSIRAHRRITTSKIISVIYSALWSVDMTVTIVKSYHPHTTYAATVKRGDNPIASAVSETKLQAVRLAAIDALTGWVQLLRENLTIVKPV